MGSRVQSRSSASADTYSSSSSSDQRATPTGGGKFEQSNGRNGHRKDWSDLNHNGDHKKVQHGRLAYITVQENATKWWVTVNGLNHHETRLLAEKVSDQPETHDDKEKIVEFSIPSWQVLNGLERMGYRVVTSSSMITGYGKHDTRDFIWTLHKTKEDWGSSSK